MRPLRVVQGRMVPLDRADVDTDQIMPKQHLKRVERAGYGDLLFSDWRADPSFVLNDARYAGARVLVAGPNFGSGSSREHAAWGLQQHGFDAVVAPSFADIFRTNCAKIGLLTVAAAPAVCRTLLDLAGADPAAVCRIDVASQQLIAWRSAGGPGPAGPAPAVRAPFDLDAHTKRCLLEGLDDVALTLRHEEAIGAFEQQRPRWLPVTAPVPSPGTATGAPVTRRREPAPRGRRSAR